MSREEVFEKLNVIFRNNFDDDGITLCDVTSSEDIEDWDRSILLWQFRMNSKLNLTLMR